MRQVAETVMPLLQKKSTVLELHVAPDIDGMHSDSVKIRQCLINILSNAAKFTEGGKVTLAAFRAHSTAGAAEIEFRSPTPASA